MITLNHVVIHRLNKEKGQAAPIPQPTLRPTELSVTNEIVLKLVNEISESYSTRTNSIQYGTFVDGAARGSFPDPLTNYLTGGASAPDFLELTEIAMNSMHTQAEAQTLATGGYIVFADFSNPSGRFFLIAMLKQKPGMRITDRLEPEELTQLDFDKLHQAARINAGKLSGYLAAPNHAKPDLTYLNFISRSAAQDAAGYFVRALGCSSGAASSKATKSVIDIPTQYFRDDEALKPKANDLRKALIDYLDDRVKNEESGKLTEIIHIIRRHIPDSEEARADDVTAAVFKSLNAEDGAAVSAEFAVNKTIVGRRRQIEGVTSHWKLTFEREALSTDPESTVYFDSESKTITVRELPDDMIRQVKELLGDEKTD